MCVYTQIEKLADLQLASNNNTKNRRREKLKVEEKKIAKIHHNTTSAYKLNAQVRTLGMVLIVKTGLQLCVLS